MLYRKIICLLFLSLLISCSRNPSRTVVGGNMKYGDTLRLSLPGPITTFFPLYNDDIYSHRLLCNLFEPLFDVADSTNNVIPRLAERFEWSKDNQVLTIYLRKGIEFTEDACFEGESNELTSEDVKFTLELACSSSNLNQSGNGLIRKIQGSQEFFNGKTPHITGLKIMHSHCIQLNLTGPYFNVPKLLSSSKYAIVSKKAYEYYKSNILYHPVGTGPFILTKHSNRQISLSYNAHYWKKDSFGNQLPYLGSVIYRIFNNTSEEIEAFKRQEIDFLFEVPTDKINGIFTSLNQLKEKKPFAHKVCVVPGSRVNLVVLNQLSGYFKDSRVRKAMDLVIDRNFIANELLNGDAIAANQGIAPPSFYYDNSSMAQKIPDYVLAKKLMKEAGYGPNNPFPTLNFYAAGNDIEAIKKYCTYLANQFRNILRLDIRMHWVSQEGRLSAIKENKADLWKVGLNPDYPDADAYFGLFYSKNPINSNQNPLLPKINSVTYDINYTLALKEKNTTLKNNFYSNCDILLNEENWVLPLLYEDYIILQNLRARNTKLSPVGILDLRSAYIMPL